MKQLIATFTFIIVIAGTILAADNNTANNVVTVSVPTVALIDLEGTSPNFTLTFTAPTEAGEALTAPADNTSLWLNLSSVVKTSSTTRLISIKMVNGTKALPSGITLSVQAASVSGSGSGNRGVPAGKIALTTVDQDFITGIKSGYTGNGTSNGFNLTYSAIVSDYSNLNFEFDPVTVVYTISGDN